MSEAGNYSDIRNLLLAASLVVATLTFVYSVFSQRKKRIQREKLDWQEVVVHSLLHKSEESRIGFSDLLTMYRSEASAVEGIDVRRKDMSEAAFRRLIISLLRKKIIEQHHGDEYSLYSVSNTTQYFDGIQEKMMSKLLSSRKGSVLDRAKLFGPMEEIMEKMLGIASESVSRRKIRSEIYGCLVGKRTGTSEAEVILSVVKSCDADQESVQNELRLLILEGVLGRSADDLIRLNPGTNLDNLLSADGLD